MFVKLIIHILFANCAEKNINPSHITHFSLDRLILALLLTAYMFVAWSPDRKDYEYQKNQLELKKLELRYDFKQ